MELTPPRPAPNHPPAIPAIARTGICALAAIIALLLTACAQDPTAPPAPTPTPIDPKAELRRTVDRLLALQSVSFALEHTVGATVLTPGIEMTRAYGSVVIPGQYDVTVEAQAAGLYIQLGAASINGATYMTNPITGQWGPVPPESIPINLLTLGATLAGIVDAVQAPQLQGKSKLNGADVYHISGRIQSQDLQELVPNAAAGHPVTLEIWMEQQTAMLRQATITGQVTPDDAPNAQRILTLNDINLPITITPPPGF